jgi:hypothetical protein
MRHASTGLRLFLGSYALLLLYHLSGRIHDMALAADIALIAGAVLAVLAHTRNGILLYSLLMAHMAIEWVEHGARHWRFAGTDGAFELTHLAFDIAFLAFLVRLSWKNAWARVLFSSLCILAALSYAGWAATSSYEAFAATPALQLLEAFTFGGIFGCTAFHLFRPFGVTAPA